MRTIVMIMALSCLMFQSYGQQSIPLYKIGDTLPEETFQSNKGPINLSDYKGKWVILNFFATTCSPCHVKMPGLMKLQKDFAKELQVLVITTEPFEKVEAFYNARPRMTRPDVPIIAADTTFFPWFVPRTLGDHVWIGPTGNVRYISDGEHTTEKTLRSAIRGEKLNIPDKSFVQPLDRNQSIWQEGGGRYAHHINFFSSISGNIENVTGSATFRRNGRMLRGVRFINTPLLSLFGYANGGLLLNKGELANSDRMLLKVKDTTKFIVDEASRSDWWKKNTYCYEAVVPETTDSGMTAILRIDLDRYFPYKTSVQKLLRPVVRLAPISGKFPKADKKLNLKSEVFSGDSTMRFEHVSANHFMYLSGGYFEKLGYAVQRQDDFQLYGTFEMPWPLRDIQSANKILRMQGYELRVEKKMIDMLVIEDK